MGLRRRFYRYTVITLLVLTLFAVPFFFEYLRTTGYVTFSPYQQAVEPLANMEPRGAQTANQVSNTMESDALMGEYYLRYQGPNLTLTYTINPSGTTWTKTALFYSVLADAQVGSQSVSFQPSRGGIRLNMSGAMVDPWNYQTPVTRSIVSQSLTSGGVHIVYNFTIGKNSTLVSVNYRIKGKTLIIDLSSQERFIDRIGPELTSGGTPQESINPVMPYASEWKYTLRKGPIFFSAYNDEMLSEASTINAFSPSLLSEGRTYWNYYVNYDTNTLKARQPMSERFYFTVSEDVSDVYPTLQHPISPYRQYMADRVVVDLWQSTYYCTDYTNYLTKLHNYGFQNLLVNNLGMCNQWQSKYVPNATAYGFDLITMGNYWDCYPSDPVCYRPDWLAQGSTGNPLLAYFNPLTGQQAYGTKSTKHIDWAQQIEPAQAAGGLKGTFIDAIVVGTPWAYLDKNATIPGGVNASLKRNYQNLIALAQYLRNVYNGPVLSEGSRPAHWAGYYDSWDGSYGCCGKDYLEPVIPDYTLREIRPLSTTYMGYLRRFVPNANNNANYKGTTTADIDKYFATGIAFGHVGLIDSPLPNLHNISDATIIRMYYMIRGIQDEYTMQEMQDVSYLVGGQWVGLSSAMLGGYDFVNAQVRVRYENGVVVYVNRHASSSFTVSYDSRSYTVPPSGYLVFNPADRFLAYSATLQGTRIDVEESPDYVFIDPRGSMINVTLQDSNYYAASRFNIGKARQPLNFTFTILNRTIITASEPLYLTRLPQTGSFVRVVMDSSHQVPLNITPLAGAPPPPPQNQTNQTNTTIPPSNQTNQSNQTNTTIPPPSADVTAPLRTSAYPTGMLAAGTQSVRFGLYTDEIAICRYSSASGVAFDSMPFTFSATNVTNHSSAQTLTDGSAYVFYARCSDLAGNRNTYDYTIAFSVNQTSPAPPPNQTNQSNQTNTTPPLPPQQPQSIEYPSAIDLQVDGIAYNGSGLNGTKTVRISKQGTPVVEFPYAFDGQAGQLNLSRGGVEYGVDDDIAGYAFVRDLPVTQKKLFVTQVDSSTVLCVKDATINSVDEISADCDQPDEYIISCPSTGQPIPQGLQADYYSFASTSLSAIPSFSGLTPSSSGTVSSLNFAPLSGAFYGTPYSDRFAVRYSGYLVVPTPGLYTFHLSSDDGSRLSIDSITIVDNDGPHGFNEVSGSQTLDEGIHTINVDFFDNVGSAGLILRWSPPGEPKQVIPALFFRRSNVTGTALSCTLSNGVFEISPLTHSGVRQYTCTQAYSCSEWSACVDGAQSRSCTCSCFGGSGCSGDSSTTQSCTTPPPGAAVCGDDVCDATESCSSCSSDCGECAPSASSSGGGGGSGGGGSYTPPILNTTTEPAKNTTTEKPGNAGNKGQTKPDKPLSTGKIIEQIKEPDGDIAPVIDVSTSSAVHRVRKSYTLSWIIIGLSILGIFAAYQLAQHHGLKQALIEREVHRRRIEDDLHGQLSDFVDVCKRHGLSDAAIRKKLQTAGWSKAQIEKAIK